MIEGKVNKDIKWSFLAYWLSFKAELFMLFTHKNNLEYFLQK